MLYVQQILQVKNIEIGVEKIKGYFEVFIDVPIEILAKRDFKNLYKRALMGKIKNVVGVDIPFKFPKNPDLVIDNSKSKKI